MRRRARARADSGQSRAACALLPQGRVTRIKAGAATVRQASDVVRREVPVMRLRSVPVFASGLAAAGAPKAATPRKRRRRAVP